MTIETFNGKRIYTEPNKLIVETSDSHRAWTLGAITKKVVVDQGSKTISIDRKIFWFYRIHQSIDFDSVAAILFDDNIFVNDGGSGGGNNQETDFEALKVSLALKTGESVYLFTFRGQMARYQQRSMFGNFMAVDDPDIIHSSDQQSSVALNYAQALSTTLDVPISKQMNI